MDYLKAIEKAKCDWEGSKDHPFPMDMISYAQHIAILSGDLLEDQYPTKYRASYRRYKGIRQTTGRKRLIEIAARCLSALENGKPVSPRSHKRKSR